MFERFSQRARRVVVLAQEEARLLSHNYIGTEHILLGLLGEPESVAGGVLARLGFTRDAARQAVEDIVGRGKKAPGGHIPFTPRAKKVLELSLREALALGHKYIGTEHILLGLIREGDGVAAQVLRRGGNLGEIRAAAAEAARQAAGTAGEESDDETNAVLRWLRHRLGRRDTSVAFQPGTRRLEPPARGTPAVEATLEQAARLAGPMPVGSHHLLLATLDDPQSAASWALAALGVDLDELRGKLQAAPLEGTSDEPPEQAGRRQMAITVTPRTLQVLLADPVIVAAGHEALRALTARAQAEQRATGAGDPPDDEAPDDEPGEAGPASVRVIRGDTPAAAGLAGVWRELHEVLVTMASAPGGPAAAPGGPGAGEARPAAGEAGPDAGPAA